MGQCHPLVAKYAQSVPDGPARRMFVKYASRSVGSWNDHTLQVLRILSTVPFRDLKDPYLCAALFSAPSAWLFYVDDCDFVDYLQEHLRLSDLDKERTEIWTLIRERGAGERGALVSHVEAVGAARLD